MREDIDTFVSYAALCQRCLQPTTVDVPRTVTGEERAAAHEQIAELQRENARLREALEPFTEDCHANIDCHFCAEDFKFARQVLAEQSVLDAPQQPSGGAEPTKGA